MREKTNEQDQAAGWLSARAATWLAWTLCAVSLALAVAGLLLLVLSREAHPGIPLFEQWAEDAVIAVGFSTLGAVVAPRFPPKNPIGWLFCSLGLVAAVLLFGGEYAYYSLLARPGSLPGGDGFAWVVCWLWVVHTGLFAFLGLLFPDGRLPTPRWRPFAWLVVAAVAAGSVAVAYSPGPIDSLAPIRNPMGIEGIPNLVAPVEIVVFALTLGAALSLLVRLRRARGVERQQIKWFSYAAFVLAAGAVVSWVISDAVGAGWLRWDVGFVTTMVGLAGLPVAMGIAILRYRLYDIDRIINRTLVYGSLTAMLVALYFGTIVVLERVFVLLTGQESTLAVVASTLLIAALFTPLRRRIQTFIDRRFYRRKYDARKTLEAFSAKLRNETDLEALNEDLVGVVRETMQPAHVSLWLRPETLSNRERRA